MSNNQVLPGTIYALSSGAGTAGIAVVRVSGASSRAVVKSLCGQIPEARQARLSRIEDPQTRELIDRGLVLWFPEPRSFNGEDMAEFHVHGSRAVIDALLRAIGRCPGTRMAEPGEFALRAFQNGRMDLTEAEGLSDLLAARTDVQRQQALRLAGGAARKIAEVWRQELLSLLARVEAAVDFVDDAGVAEEAQAQISSRLDSMIEKVSKALESSARGEAIRDGIKVVIAGPPNAGKSSLLNFISGRDAAIVSSKPGTTRDVIEVSLDMAGLPVIFTDTAGLREGSADEIELMGMERSRREMRDADVVLWLTAPGSEARPEEGLDSKSVWVWNKSDLPESSSRLIRNDPDYLISVKSGQGMADLLNGLKMRIESAYRQNEPAVIVRARQRECTETLLERLISARQHRAFSLELIAEDLRAAADALGRLTGKINVEDVLGEIFAEFCIGK